MAKYFRPKSKEFHRFPLFPLHAAGGDYEGSFVELREWVLIVASPFIRLFARKNWREDSTIYRSKDEIEALAK